MRDLDGFLAHLRSIFAVTVQDAREIIAAFHREMEAGLKGEESSLKMIPSFVGPPRGTEKGDCLVLDLGGTNIRVLAVALDGKGNASVSAVSRFVIPENLMGGPGDALFNHLADCLRSFFEQHGSGRQRPGDLAFTFSFPVEQHSLVAGKLINWTKKFTAAGVVGRDVVALLAAALARRRLGFIKVASLANDTVGTLVAGAYADPSCDLGVILGTGTNACYPEQAAKIRKCPEPGASGVMIVNIEWGGFSQLPRNVYDQELDGASPNAGRQWLEKMVAGMYLGEIARRIIVDMMTRGLLFRGTDPAVFSSPYMLQTEHLSRLARGADFYADFGLPEIAETDRQTLREICLLVASRSARIAGAAIAAVVTWQDATIARNHTVAIDGSLFEKYPEYQYYIMAMLEELFGIRAKRIKLALVKDGSGIGSAIIGAMAVAARTGNGSDGGCREISYPDRQSD